MSESSEAGERAWQEAVDNGDDPERCPICGRTNLPWQHDYCEHHWGTLYDGELSDCTPGEEFERLWTVCNEVSQYADDIKAHSYIARLRTAHLDEIARALKNEDKYWWLENVGGRVRIEPKDSPASGAGWSLYDKSPTWFDGLLGQMREAAALSNSPAS